MNLVRHGALGDVVLLGAVTSGGMGFTVVTKPKYHRLCLRMKGVERVVSPGTRVAGPTVDLQRSLRTLWHHPTARRVRKHSIARRWWGRPPVTELYARAARVSVTSSPWFELPTRPRDALALVPGAAWRPKQAPPEALLAAASVWEGPVVVLGGPGEAARCERLAGLVQGEAVVEDGFDRTLDALARTAVTVAGDTGLMHLAGACGSRVVAVFGPTHPRDGFFVHDGVVVQRARDCRPCGLHRIESCHRGDVGCTVGLHSDVRTAVAAMRRT